MKKSFFLSQNGQSLVEVVVAIGVTVLVVVALLQTVTYSIKNVNFSRARAAATKYSQEALEKIIAFKSRNSWEVFTSQCETIITDSLPSPFDPDIIVNCYQPGNETTDCLSSVEICEIKVKVVWTDAGGDHDSTLVTRLSKWQ